MAEAAHDDRGAAPDDERDGGKDRRRGRPRSRTARSISKRQGCASKRRSAPRSDLSSGWSGSGPIISASRPTRSKACPAPMSARPSVPMCLAGSPTCCWRSRAIPPCCSISTTSPRWARIRSAGINRTRGLNENLAREILELHTLGVRSGYSQDDVIGFAKVLTGWTLVPPGDNPEHGGEFTFNPRLHEPGAQKVLGKVYEEEDGGAGTRRAARSGRTSRDRHASRHQAGAPFHRRCACRRRWSRGWRRSFSIPTAISRKSPRRWFRRPNPGRSRPPSSSARASGSSAWCARPGSRKPIRHGSPAGRPCSANRLWRSVVAQRLSGRRSVLD